MKKLGVLFNILLISFALQAQIDTTAFKQISKQIQTIYAPDKRAIYFNIQFKGDTVLAESTSELVLSQWNEKAKNVRGLKVSASLPDKSLNGMEYGLANLSVCNNRSMPQNSAEMMTQMLLGTPVQVLKKQGGFYLVRTPDNYLSWTDATAVSLMSRKAWEDWKEANRIIFTEDFGHALSTTHVNSERVSDLVKGNILEVIGADRRFYKVVFPDKRVGFVKKNEAKRFADWLKTPNPDAELVLKTAKTLIGVPYLWGGTSVKGVDCSGFTKTSYFLNGIVIPRDASQQALVGEDVEVLENDSISISKCLKNLKPGDLLFFAAAKLRGVKGGRVTHTAIYMGDGTFIQAAGMVRINSLKPDAINFDERESKTLVSAKRYLNQIGQAEISRVDQHKWYVN
ncbi:hypothetical protein DHW03_00370 [Pedobacter yonginense]|uniref:NlpC/P60 domain-containing protein n=1 Tax=Pedobacter yonginense TaxID=651869 RepID=A0A317EQA5_9SPHI|nr:C40 family peptidase [Pedobacter yonginense]PWS28347.1 hypothetical protein DHW03_00370 [Pedobacter yonginense]